MDKQQIKWASQHDWYSHANGDVVYVREGSVDAFGNWHTNILAFNDFQALREWAGY